MALSILDGNQSQATLSTIVTGGQHISAHTVVSLGTQAITDMRSAVSGSVVSISNFPSTQTIAGTVTANVGNAPSFIGGGHTNLQDLIVYSSFEVFGEVALNTGIPAGTNRIGVVTVGGGSVTLGAGTAQIGSVTANVNSLPLDFDVQISNGLRTFNQTEGSFGVSVNYAEPITGTVTLGAGTAQIGSVTASISNSVTIASLPAISGTVTANTFALQGTAVTTSNFTSTTASTVLAGYNATREVLTIFNEGAGNLHIAPGATCTTIAYQVRLSAGDYYEVPNHQTTITHSAVFATAGTARVVQIS